MACSLHDTHVLMARAIERKNIEIERCRDLYLELWMMGVCAQRLQMGGVGSLKGNKIK
jgi:hypothetical protein